MVRNLTTEAKSLLARTGLVIPLLFVGAVIACEISLSVLNLSGENAAVVAGAFMVEAVIVIRVTMACFSMRDGKRPQPHPKVDFDPKPHPSATERTPN